MSVSQEANKCADSDTWPILVISLADACERRQKIAAQCAELGLEIEIIDAIDGRNGLAAEFEARIDRAAARSREGRSLSDAEFACALSHRSIYQRIVEDGLLGAVILEDDAIPSPQFADFVQKQGYREADFIQMDYSPARVFWRQRRNWSGEIELVPLAENTCLASGYSISARGARYMLSRTTPLAGVADWPCDMVPLGPLITLPKLVQQPQASSVHSSLMAERDVLFENRDPATSRWKRFGQREYWRRWWLKRRTRRIS